MTETGGEAIPPLRIGNAERNAALKALDAHLEAGRLDAVEYGERSAHVTEARTADEIRPLFADLPAPHPDLADGHAPVRSVTGDGPVVASAAPGPPASATAVWGPRLAAIMPFVALVLFFAVPWDQSWLFFLLIPAAGVLFAGSRDDRDDVDDRDDGRRPSGHDLRGRGRDRRPDGREQG